ncbi:MAG TPA: serine/threonine-protein kinase [Myxococcales bacterium]|nr:serine/threonine-protein kinase [Myxococcales bacterium]
MSTEEIVGRYRLTRKIATGGMAEIWLASADGPEGFRKRLVVKKILPHLADDEEFVRMFLDEARIAARLNHPNIVQIFDLGEADGSYFIAMEYVPGKDLRRTYQDSAKAKKTLPPELIVRVLIESAKALDYAHRATDDLGEPLHIVHRDVSPQNILVTFQGGVKLVDFGIAKAADQATQTRAGVLKGKYSYMSPEQAAGDAIDSRTDIFALGIVGYELITGFRLFKRENEVATLQAVRECKVPPPSTIARDVPKALDRIFSKALAKKPDERLATAGELALALEEFLLAGHYAASSTHLAEFMQALYPELDEDSSSRPPAAPRESQSGSSARKIPIHPPEPVAPPRPPSVPPRTSASTVAGVPRVKLPRAQTGSQAATKPKGWQTADDLDLKTTDLKTVELKKKAIGPAAARTELPTRIGAGRTEAPTRIGAPAGEAETEVGEPAAPQFPDDTPEEISVPSRRFRLPPLPSPGARRLLARLGLAGVAAALAIAALPTLRGWVSAGRALTSRPAGSDAGCLLCGLVPQDEGKLTLVTEPAATVYLGQEALGSTPLVEAPLASGHLILRVVNDSLALDEQIPVDVKPNKLTTVQRTFSQGTAALAVPKGHSYAVYFRDKALGRVPGPPIQMVEGSHVLTLVDEESGQRQQRTVEVKVPKQRATRATP